MLNSAFPHECQVETKYRKLPAVVNDQELRYLRHQQGEQHYRGRFADCPHCGHRWTNAELVQSYLINGVKIEGLNQYPDNVRRLKSIAIEYQKSPADNLAAPSEIVEAGWNHHMHAGQACFGKAQRKKKSGEKRKLSNPPSRECRYRYPQSKRYKTSIDNVSETPIKWFAWDGTSSDIHVKEILRDIPMMLFRMCLALLLVNQNSSATLTLHY